MWETKSYNSRSYGNWQFVYVFKQENTLTLSTSLEWKYNTLLWCASVCILQYVYVYSKQDKSELETIGHISKSENKYES